jgi:hypothetical protein
MKYNKNTGQTAEKVPEGTYEGIDYHGEPPADVAARAGWVDVTPEIQAIVDAEEAQRQADAAAAAEAEALAPRDVELGKATLRTYPDGSVELLSGPLILPGTTNGAYEVWIDADTGLVLTVLDHASPRKSKAEKDAAKADKKAKIAAVKAAQTDKAKLVALLDLLGLK